jgi:nucleotide-binding universal stress UspA family protein
MGSNKIVVGIDGSGPSLAALRWAAREAQRHGADLDILMAYLPPAPGPLGALTEEHMEAADDAAESAVAAAVAEARRVAAKIRVHGKPRLGIPVLTLIRAGDRAGMLVVGSRGGGGFASLLAGSVSVAVATRATCPIAVVRGRSDDHTGPVVVGVDGSASSDFATGLAFEEATRRGCSLTVVHAYHEPLAVRSATLPSPHYDPDRYQAGQYADLVASTDGWRSKYPDVAVDHMAVPGGAARTLVGCSRRARLVVVGNRDHRAGGELLLGSVGLQLMQHAECPVLIARPRHDDR